MLSSRWTGVNVYKCTTLDNRAPVMYILASNTPVAKAAYKEATRTNPDYCDIFLREVKVAITEEAQAQSVLFPNGIKEASHLEIGTPVEGKNVTIRRGQQ